MEKINNEEKTEGQKSKGPEVVQAGNTNLALENAKKVAEAVFAEFEKFTTENPNKPIPQYLEAKNRLAEENIARAERGEPMVENHLAAGEERYERISNSLSGARTKLSSWLSKTGSFFKKGMLGALGVPEAIVTGTEHTGKKIVEGADYLATKTEQFGDSVEANVINPTTEGAQFVAQKTVEGTKYVGKKIVEGADYLATKTEQFGDSVEANVINPVYNFTVESYKNAQKFRKENYQKAIEFKKETGVYLSDKALTVEAIASLAKEKTLEELNKAKMGMEKTYNGIVEYGKSAIETATLRAWYAKDTYQKKKNSFWSKILERKENIKNTEAARVLEAKLAQHEQVANLEAQFA